MKWSANLRLDGLLAAGAFVCAFAFFFGLGTLAFAYDPQARISTLLFLGAFCELRCLPFGIHFPTISHMDRAFRGARELHWQHVIDGLSMFTSRVRRFWKRRSVEGSNSHLGVVDAANWPGMDHCVASAGFESPREDGRGNESRSRADRLTG